MGGAVVKSTASSFSHDSFEVSTGRSRTWQPAARLSPVAASKHEATVTRKPNPRHRDAGTARDTSTLLQLTTHDRDERYP
jgi:hypothetical protein